MIVFPEGAKPRQEEMNRLIASRIAQDLREVENQGGWGQADQRTYFSPWSWLQHQDRCERALPELKLMAEDRFAHDLTPFLEYVLYQALDRWIGRSGESGAANDGSNGDDQHRDANYLDELMDVAFYSTDFLHTEEIATSVLEGTDYVPRLGIDPNQFLDLMPDDIRLRVEEVLRPGSQPEQPDDVGSTP